MFDMLNTGSPPVWPGTPWLPPQKPSSGQIQDEAVPSPKLFKQVLDLLDYGLVLVDAEGHVLHSNRAAGRVLDELHPLQQFGRSLRALHASDVVQLADAIRAACQRGQRRLLSLGKAGQRAVVAALPLVDGELRAEHGLALLVLGRRNMCEDLSLDGYARVAGLTLAETEVLRGLCGGQRPSDIARQHKVAVSTIRTQVACVRAKMGAKTINSLVRQVATLPPIVNALRGAM